MKFSNRARSDSGASNKAKSLAPRVALFAAVLVVVFLLAVQHPNSSLLLLLSEDDSKTPFSRPTSNTAPTALRYNHVAALVRNVEPAYKDVCRRILLGESLSFGQGFQDWYIYHNIDDYLDRKWGDGWVRIVVLEARAATRKMKECPQTPSFVARLSLFIHDAVLGHWNKPCDRNLEYSIFRQVPWLERDLRGAQPEVPRSHSQGAIVPVGSSLRTGKSKECNHHW